MVAAQILRSNSPVQLFGFLAPGLLLDVPEADVDKRTSDIADLRYLGANSVQCSAGNLSDFRVCTEDSQPLGSVEGVLISPTTRRCEFFVVESAGLLNHRQFLVPVEAGASVKDGFNTLQIAARKDELDFETFTPSSVPPFSDEDLMPTVFSRDAA